jgi:moderate conductance mechanosensitive channel
MKELIEKWTELMAPWLLLHGIKILFIVLGTYILNRFLKRSIEKIVRIAVVSDKYLSKQAEEKREDTLISIFTWTSRIIILFVATVLAP